MARVLVVEDDPDLRVLLATALKHAGHAPQLAATGKVGLELARSLDPDLLLLDLMLPDLSGVDIVSSLKTDATTRRIPVIILSARAAEADRVLGLELGAEDYVTKPFSLRELLLRAANVLRRASLPDGGSDTTLACENTGIRINLRSREVRVREQEITLTPIEFRLLATLASRAGLVQSREVLLADVWGAVPDVETRTVDAHMKRLREKLGPAAGCLETMRGVGYRFRSAGDKAVAPTFSAQSAPAARGADSDEGNPAAWPEPCS